jgi:hypothetical protein
MGEIATGPDQLAVGFLLAGPAIPIDIIASAVRIMKDTCFIGGHLF